jgi:hypothetical protein
MNIFDANDTIIHVTHSADESLEAGDEGGISEAWRIEAEARLAQVERGEARLIPGDEVLAKLRSQQA